MEVRVPRTVLDRIRSHAREMYPEECCGFLIGRHDGSDRAVTEARPAKNVSTESRSTQYAIDSDLVRRTEAEFRVGPLRVVGFYHSHPEGAAVPSERDRRRAWPYYVYAIVSVKGTGPSDFKAWRLDDDLQEFVPIGVLLT